MEWIAAIYETIVDFFTGIAEFLKNFRLEFWEFIRNPQEILNPIYEFILDVYYNIVNLIIELLGNILEWVASITPDPFSGIPDADSLPARFLSAFNWIFPTSSLINSVEILIASTVLWMTIGILLKWAKVSA